MDVVKDYKSSNQSYLKMYDVRNEGRCRIVRVLNLAPRNEDVLG